MTTKKSKGLGDTVEKVFQAVGIDKIVKFVAGEDCGCDGRKDVLNNILPYKKDVQCLNENEYEILKDLFSNEDTTLSPIEKQAISKIYNRLFDSGMSSNISDSILRDIMDNLKSVYEAY